MPTIQPLPGEADGNGEGQLKPIEARVKIEVTNPAAASAVSSTAPAPAPKYAPTARMSGSATPRSTASVASAPRLTPKMSGGPRLTHQQSNECQSGADAAVSESQGRNSRFTSDQLMKLWDDFIAAHPKEAILVNTMRAAHPEPVDASAPEQWRVTVENEAQQSKLTEFMPELMRYLREGVKNDALTLEIAINQGAGSSRTWNEREVLAHMLETAPALRKFISEFKLNLG